MNSVFDFLDTSRQPTVPRPENDAIAKLNTLLEVTRSEFEAASDTGQILSTAFTKHSRRILEDHAKRSRSAILAAQTAMNQMRSAQAESRLVSQFFEYLQDASQRALLTADALRKRGDIFLDHEQGRPVHRRSDQRDVADNPVASPALPPGAWPATDDRRYPAGPAFDRQAKLLCGGSGGECR
jgi:hypothetical protein